MVAERLLERAVGFEFVEQQAVKVKRVEYHENGKKTLETEDPNVSVELLTAPSEIPLPHPLGQATCCKVHEPLSFFVYRLGPPKPI